MDYLMKVLIICLFAAHVNAPNLPNINESLPSTNDLQMSLTTEVNSLSKRQADDLKVFKERISDGMFKVWMPPTHDHSFRVVKDSGTEEEFTGCSEPGSDDNSHSIYVHRASSWQYVYVNEGSIEIDGNTYNIGQISEITTPSGCLDPMLRTTITTTEMTATTCYPVGTPTPDPPVNPGATSDQGLSPEAIALVVLAIVLVLVLLLLAVAAMLGGIIAWHYFKPKKAREPVNVDTSNHSNEEKSISKSEEETIRKNDDNTGVEESQQDKGENSHGRLHGGYVPPKDLTRDATSSESQKGTPPPEACSDNPGTKDSPEPMDLQPSQQVSGNNLGTSSSTLDYKRMDDSEEVM